MKILLTLVFAIITLSLKAQTVFNDSIAPKFEITDWINNPEKQAALNNKHIVLEFWSTTCGPCLKAIPHINTLHEAYNKDIAFVSVNSSDSKERIEKFLTTKTISNFIGIDENKSLKKGFDIQTIPAAVLIDKNGYLRWKGLAKDLTEKLINTFLEKDLIIDEYPKGVIFNKTLTMRKDENIKYQIKVEYGDNTKGKSVSWEFDENFEFVVGNSDIYSILGQYSNWFGIENDWKYKGVNNNNNVLIISVLSNTILKKRSERQQLIEDVIIQLSKIFKFQIEYSEETQDIWVISADTLELNKHISKDQNLDDKMTKKTDEYTSYTNIFFERIAFRLATRFNQKFECHSSVLGKYYDLTIPNTKDINELKTYLSKQYGIILKEGKKQVNIRTVVFQ